MAATTDLRTVPELAAFYRENPGFDAARFDFLDAHAVDALKWSGDKVATLETLKAYQRLLRITPDATVAGILLEAGLDSAHRITRLGRGHFVKEYGPRLGRDGAAVARQVYVAAANVKSRAAHLAANVHSLSARHSRALRVGSTPPAIADHFSNLSSYQDLFGSLDDCDCQECGSIFGPAAYFVDLQRIIDRAVTQPNRATIPDGLALPARRPDLARIPLTCAQTNDLVPYLEIVNGILEETLKRALADDGNPVDDLFLTLAGTKYPWNLPAHLPLLRIRSYLGSGDLTLADVFRAFGPPGEMSRGEARELLGLSVEQLENLAPPAEDALAARVSANYGLSITGTDLRGLDRLTAWLDRTGLTQEDVRGLLNQDLGPREIFDASGDYATRGDGRWGESLKLAQHGDGVSGEFEGGTLAGTLRDFVLAGRWEAPGQDPAGGNVELTFSPDGSGFTGRWSRGYGPWETTPWNGTRSAGTPATGGIIPHCLFINKVLPEREYLRLSTRGTESDEPYVQLDGLTLETLDTVNRFVRLSRAVGIGYGDLDWLLTTLHPPSVDGDGHLTSNVTLDEATFRELAKVRRLTDEYGLPLDLLVTLWFDVRTTGVGNGEHSAAPFDVLFNPPDVPAHAGGARLYHPRIASGYVNPLYREESILEWWPGPAPDAATDTPEKAALRQRANAVVAGIPAPAEAVLAVAAAAFDEGRSVPLTVANLSLLYRHTMLAKALGLRVPDYLALLRLLRLTADGNKDGKIRGVFDRDDVLLVARTVEWMRAAGLTVYDLAYVCDSALSPYVDAGYSPSNLDALLASVSHGLSPALLRPEAFVHRQNTAEQSAAWFRTLLQQRWIDNLGVVIEDPSAGLPDFSALPEKLRPDAAQAAFVSATIARAQADQARRFAETLGSFLGVKADVLGTLVAGARDWGAGAGYLDRFVLAPLFSSPAEGVTKAASGETLTLDPVKLPDLFRSEKGVTLSRPSVTPQAPNAWAIEDGASGQIYYAFTADPEVGKASEIRFLQPLGSGDAGVPDPVGRFVREISRYLRLQQALALSTAEVAHLFAVPAAYGITAQPPALDVAAVRDVARLKNLVAAFGEPRDGLLDYLARANGKTPPDGTPPDGTPPDGTPSDETPPDGARLRARLHAVTGWKVEQIAAMAEALSFPGDGTAATVDAVCRLERIFTLAAKRGTDVYLLQDLAELGDPDRARVTEASWTTWQHLAGSLLQALKARTTEEAWPTTREQLEAPVEDARRDAMLPLAIREVRRKFGDVRTARDLYEILLIDFEMSGCAQISYVKEGLNACQLYLQRCRLNLERGVTIDTDDLPEIFWEWIMNYRVWQANREIFLYPENYLDPTLRKSKTRLFEDLESTLLQGELTQETVEAAYRKYLDGLAKLGKLRYVDAYHATVHDVVKGAVDTLFLFARTREEPYSFYVTRRRRLGATPASNGAPGDRTKAYDWSQWRKIGISINSRYVTPAFAFNKLFVFWVELTEKKEPSGTAPNDPKVITTSAAIKYSFQDFGGEWLQPQTLLSDLVIDVRNSGEDLHRPFEREFARTDAPYWRKVAAVRVARQELEEPGGSPGAERLSLYFGPMFVPNAAAPESPLPAKADPEGVQAFKKTLHAAAYERRQLGELEAAGHSPLLGSITVDWLVEGAWLLFEDEYLVLEPDPLTASSAPTFTAAITGSSVAVEPSYTALYSNYVEGMGLHPIRLWAADERPASPDMFESPYTSPADSAAAYKALTGGDSPLVDSATGKVGAAVLTTTAADVARTTGLTPSRARIVLGRLLEYKLGTLVLFGNASTRSAEIIPVKNQPGAFLLGSGDEFFLLEASSAPPESVAQGGGQFQKIDRSLSVGSRFQGVTPTSFISQNIDWETSMHVWKILTNKDRPPTYLVDPESGRVDVDTVKKLDPSFLGEGLQISPGQAQEVKEVLLSGFGPAGLAYGTPPTQVTASDFVMPGISSKLAGNVFSILSKPPTRLIAEDGTVDAATLGRIDAGMLGMALPMIDSETVGRLRDVLVAAAGGGDFGVDDNLFTLQFRTTRLSTGAIMGLSQALTTGGIDGLLALPRQQAPVDVTRAFDRLEPSTARLAVGNSKGEPVLVPPATKFAEQVEFAGPYGRYYWELFFHSPMLVAQMLNADQRFREASAWWHHVFDPTVPFQPLTESAFLGQRPRDLPEVTARQVYAKLTAPGINTLVSPEGAVLKTALTVDVGLLAMGLQVSDGQAEEIKNLLVNNYLATPEQRFWQFVPFRNHDLETLVEQLRDQAQIAEYNDDPFDPHAIARLRVGAYEKAVVMKYVDNLLDWGDAEFSKYTWESITAARMLYVYAYDLLGPKPADLGPCDAHHPATFADVEGRYAGIEGGIPQFLIDLEHVLDGGPPAGPGLNPVGKAFNDVPGYFCVPENSRFTAYWDRVQDRLYKIRHCLDIDGKKRPLPLFQPPIDPMELVRAAASGGNVLEVAGRLEPNVPQYRFHSVFARARDFASRLAQLGGALQNALERSDAEALALLHSTQSGTILTLSTRVKEKQIEDLESQLAALQQSRQSAGYRRDHFKSLISGGLNAAETVNLVLSGAALYPQELALGVHGITIAGYLAPNIFGFSDGGMKFGDAINAGARILDGVAQMLNQSASLAATVGQHQRRADDWRFQQQLAEDEIDQIAQQIAATQARIAAGRQELAVHKKQIEQRRQEEDFLKSKFTDQQLYLWMIGRISAIYFQAYRLALDLALAAQAAYRYELDRTDEFVTLGYWDSLHKGLLAGEALALSLSQLEKAYLENDERRLEIEKTISLRREFPEAFLGFKWGHQKGTPGEPDGAHRGELRFTLGERLFDFDFPGHYARKIKTVSVSIPAVVGPYQNLNATLTQNGNFVVLEPSPAAVDYLIYRTAARRSGDPPDAPAPGALRENWVPDQQIALSRGVDDSGLFVLDFRDERYLPFEGTGAVSSWTLSLPPDTNRIDYDSISDVLVKVRYTARDGGSRFADQVRDLYKKGFKKQGQETRYQDLEARVFDLQQAFPADWHRMFATAPDAGGLQRLAFPVTGGAGLPNLGDVAVSAVLLQIEVAGDGKVEGADFAGLQAGGQPQEDFWVEFKDNFGELTPGQISSLAVPPAGGSWTLLFQPEKVPGLSKTDASGKWTLDPDKLSNVALVVVYSAAPF